jgi:hypothetical protein
LTGKKEIAKLRDIRARARVGQSSPADAAWDMSLSVVLPASVSAPRYVRFFSVADGWSDSAYIPDTKVKNGMTIIFR